METNKNRRKDISLYGDILSVSDICEYLGVAKADAQRIIEDPKLKKLPVPIKQFLSIFAYLQKNKNQSMIQSSPFMLKFT